MPRKLVAIWIVVAVSLLPQPIIAQQIPPATETSPIRELHIPFDELKLLLGTPSERVFLSREEYQALKEKASSVKSQKSPIEVALVQATYNANVEEGRADIEATLKFDVLGEGLVSMPLQFSSVGIRSATLDGKPASLGRDPANQTILFLEGVGQHELTLDMTTALSTTAAQQTLSLQVPVVSAATFKMSVPGNVEVKAGAAVLSRTVDSSINKTNFEILPQAGPMSIVMSLNNRMVREQRVVVARSVSLNTISQGNEYLHSSMSMEVLHGSSQSYRFTIPSGYDVTEVTTPQLERWLVTEQEGSFVLEVFLREATTEKTSSFDLINITLSRTKPQLGAWSFPVVKPLDVQGHASVFGLILENPLQIEKSDTGSLIAIDSSTLANALPSHYRLETLSPGSLRPVGVFFSPQGEATWTANLARPESKRRVTTNLLMSVADRGLDVNGGFAILAEIERVFHFDFFAPSPWQVTQVLSDDGSPLPFERHDAEGGIRVRVMLPKAIEPNETRSFLFVASHTPSDWLTDWKTQSISFPGFRLLDTTLDVGALALVDADDLVSTPVQTDGLTPLNQDEKKRFRLQDVATSISFRYDSHPWNASIQFDRATPRIRAKSYSFYSIQPEALTTHHELVFDIDQARAQELRFSLPETTPTEVAINGLDGLIVRETNSRVEAGRRVWSVLLAERKSGSLRISVDFQQNLPSQEPIDWLLPDVRAENVAYQSGAIAIEGNPELDVQIKKSPRRIDVGEFVDTQYEIGRRLIGAFGYVTDSPNVTVDVIRRKIYPLPAALVQKATVITALSTQGISQSVARFQIRTKAVVLEVKLPAQSKLWAALLNGKPLLPQREGDRLIIGLPATSAPELRDLQLVYEEQLSPFILRKRLKLESPVLFVGDDVKTEPSEVPMADLEWQVSLPNGYRLTNSGGTVFPSDETLPPSVDKALWQRLLEIGHVFDPIVAQEQIAGRSATLSSDGYARDTETYLYRNIAPKPPAAFDSAASAWADGETMLGRDSEAMVVDETIRLEPFGTEEALEKSGGAKKAPNQPLDRLAIEGKEAIQEAEQLRGLNDLPQVQLPLEPTANLPSRTSADELAASVKGKQMDWVLEGVRSLDIDLNLFEDSTRTIFKSLASQAHLEATLVDGRRMSWIAWALTLSTILLGVYYMHRSWAFRIKYVLGLVLVSLLIPTVTPWQSELSEITDGLQVAALLLAAWYTIVGFSRSLVRILSAFKQRIAAAFSKRNLAAAKTNAVLILLAATLSSFLGNNVHAQETSITQIEELLKKIQGQSDQAAVSIPHDAVLIPYDPTQLNEGEPTSSTEKILVPYSVYEELWNKAYPDRKLTEKAPPAQYAYTGAEYRATLVDSDSLMVEGTLGIELFTDDPTDVPLPMGGGVLINAKIDGAVAKIRIPFTAGLPGNQVPNSPVQQLVIDNAMQQQAPQIAMQQAAVPLPQPAAPISLIRLEGRGRKTIQLQFRFNLERQGGWRIGAGELPSAPAAKIVVSVPVAQTEVRMEIANDRPDRTTTQVNENYAVPLPLDGRFSIQWRPKVAEAEVDQGLKIDSLANIELQEDAIRVAWRLRAEFRRGRRETLTLKIPLDFLLEKIEGANVRGWTTKASDAHQDVVVTLLKPAVESEEIVVHLAKYGAVGIAPLQDIKVPNVEVPEAILHQGDILLRRSALLEVKVLRTVGVARTDMASNDEISKLTRSRNPVPLNEFQAYHFAMLPAEIEVNVQPVAAKVTTALKTLLKTSVREVRIETRIDYLVTGRSLFRTRVEIPTKLNIDPPTVPFPHEWSIVEEDGKKLLDIRFTEGAIGEFPIIVTGALDPSAVTVSSPPPNTPPAPLSPPNSGSLTPVRTFSLPQVAVLDTVRQEGELVIQADPSLNVRTEQLSNCEAIMLSQTYNWLASAQRELARVAIRYTSTAYSGQVIATAKTPSVVGYSITNVKVTDRAIEETIYIEWKIQEAGIREVSFRLPISMRDARIQSPLVRQKFITPSATAPNEEVQIRLLLQDEVMGQYSLVVEYDRPLSLTDYSAPIPIIETGRTDRRYITLENAGLQELVVTQRKEIEPLDRQRNEWKNLARLLGGKSAEAFVVREGTNTPLLAFTTKDRAKIETAGARIGFSQTLLVLDASGAFRATQEYRVENQTEQFLDVELPGKARLWGVFVADEPVKPVEAPTAQTSVAAQSNFTIRIPLIKTAEGDLDYGVVIKYGGQLDSLGSFGTIRFPLPKTINISVEESHVRLRLPESHQWFDFGGTMGQVQSQEDLTAGWLSFKTKQIEKLTELLSSSNDKSFSKARATNNLKQLESTMNSFNSLYAQSEQSNRFLQEQLLFNKQAVSQATQQLQSQSTDPSSGAASGNRELLSFMSGEQVNGRANGVLSDLGSNFPAADVNQGVPQKQQEFSLFLGFAQNSFEQQVQANDKQTLLGTEALKEANDFFARPLARESKPMAQELQSLSKAQAPDAVDLSSKVGKSLNAGKGAQVEGRFDSDFEDADKRISRYQQRLESSGNNSQRLGNESARSSLDALYGSTAQNYAANPPDAKNDVTVPNGGKITLGGITRNRFDQAQQGQGNQWGIPAPPKSEDDKRAWMAPNADSSAALNSLNSFADLPNATPPLPQIQLNQPEDLTRKLSIVAAAPQADFGDELAQKGYLNSSEVGYLASLDVEFPVRGKEYLFTTPRGEIEITAKNLSSELTQRLYTLLKIGAVALVIWGVFRLWRSVSNQGRIVTSVLCLLLVVGLGLWLGGLAPAFGIVLMALSLLALVERTIGTSKSNLTC